MNGTQLPKVPQDLINAAHKDGIGELVDDVNYLNGKIDNLVEDRNLINDQINHNLKIMEEGMLKLAGFCDELQGEIDELKKDLRAQDFINLYILANIDEDAKGDTSAFLDKVEESFA